MHKGSAFRIASRVAQVYVCLLALSVLWVSEIRSQDFTQAPLREILQYVQDQYQVQFSFKDANVDGKTIDFAFDTGSLEDALRAIFRQTDLQYKFLNDRHVIVTRPGGSDPGNTICGFVENASDGSPLEGVHIRIKGRAAGTVTDANGTFILSAGVRPTDTLLISYLGMETIALPADSARQVPCPTIRLHSDVLLTEQVIITEYLSDGIEQASGGNAIAISPQRLNAMPGAVEPDVFHAILMLPGVSNPDEAATRLYIRGGTPDQNLVLWDGIPLYHTGHFFGMISALNPYVINRVDVFRSDISARYGGRTSSVIDMQSDPNIPEQVSVGIGLNMTHAHLNGIVPLGETMSLQLSLRRSISDGVLTPTFRRYAEKVFQGTKVEIDRGVDANAQQLDLFNFTDFNLKWQWNPGRNRFAFNVFGAENILNYTSEIEDVFYAQDILNLTNGGVSLQWDRQWNDNYHSSLTIHNTEYDSDYSLNVSFLFDVENILFRAGRNNFVNDLGVLQVNELRLTDQHALKFGYQFSHQDISLALSNEEESEINVDTTKFGSIVHSLFGEYRLELEDVVHITTGLRYQYATPLKSHYFEPRVSVRAFINPHWSLKINSGKQFQFVSQLVFLDLNDLGLSNEIWIASDNQAIPVIESNQWSGGILFSRDGWTIDVEGYVKELAGLTTLSNGFVNLPDQPFSAGAARIRGVDILVKRRNEHTRTWLSYTLAKSEYEFRELDVTPFPASHDQRHTFQLVHLIDADPWEFSLGWQFKSGLPFTMPAGIDTFEDPDGNTIPYIAYAAQNSSRLKPYHRLDASVLYHFEAGKRMQGFAGISFLNLYNRRNPLGVDYFLDDGATPGTPEIFRINKSGLRLTPNAVIKIKW